MEEISTTISYQEDRSAFNKMLLQVVAEIIFVCQNVKMDSGKLKDVSNWIPALFVCFFVFLFFLLPLKS